MRTKKTPRFDFNMKGLPSCRASASIIGGPCKASAVTRDCLEDLRFVAMADGHHGFDVLRHLAIRRNYQKQLRKTHARSEKNLSFTFLTGSFLGFVFWSPNARQRCTKWSGFGSNFGVPKSATPINLVIRDRKLVPKMGPLFGTKNSKNRASKTGPFLGFRNRTRKPSPRRMHIGFAPGS